MIACVDVDYRSNEAVAACLVFRCWNDERVMREAVDCAHPAERYEPGAFFRRELPCIVAVLRTISEPLDTVIIDGYVWLGDEKHPGLGAHLFEALDRQTSVIGVAKRRHRPGDAIREVLRGRSRRPLYITGAGIDPSEAARRIAQMSGPHRIPDLLKRVDQLCRSAQRR